MCKYYGTRAPTLLEGLIWNDHQASGLNATHIIVINEIVPGSPLIRSRHMTLYKCVLID